MSHPDAATAADTSPGVSRQLLDIYCALDERHQRVIAGGVDHQPDAGRQEDHKRSGGECMDSDAQVSPARFRVHEDENPGQCGKEQESSKRRDHRGTGG